MKSGKIPKYFRLYILFFFLAALLLVENYSPKIIPNSKILKEDLMNEIRDEHLRNTGEVLNYDTKPDATLDLGTHKVVRIVDGDTFELEDGRVVRYIGIDAPEKKKGQTQAECFAQESHNYHINLVLNKQVRLEKDVSIKDFYGRTLAYVWIGNKFVNKSMVEEGMAKAVSYPPDIKYQSALNQAEDMSRINNKGLWSSACNNQTSFLNSSKVIN